MEARSAPLGGLGCRGLVAAPGGSPVLRGVDLDVPAGTRTVLVGPSGAGKTTLLRAICGLQAIEAGSIELGGRRIDRLPAYRRRCAVVFQEPRLLPHLDVGENVAFALRAAGARRAERRARARALLTEVGLDGFERRAADRLSGGEQQRVSLARALCAEPDILLLDEPISAVDANRREELRELIARLQGERGLTTLFVTHDRAEAAQMGERVALMLEGRIVQEDEPAALFQRPASPVVARFFGSANVLRGQVRDGRMSLGGVEVPVPGPDGEACVTIRPERVRLDPAGPLELRVGEAAYTGTWVRLRLRGEGLGLEAMVPPSQAPAAGELVGVALPLEEIWRIPDFEAVPEEGRRAGVRPRGGS
ncbi:MAG: ABC transporter ATP-binding protein [Actinobacteria bacterium]|nr:ABC transporter ATP-binding protein [Actinomycetota bacterium]